VDIDAVEIRAWRRVAPGAAEQVNRVPARNDPPENFLQMQLGATGLGIGEVLPVDDEYPH